MINFKIAIEKLEFWKIKVHYHELDSLLIIIDLSDWDGGYIDECDLLKVFNEMCQHLEDLHN